MVRIVVVAAGLLASTVHAEGYEGYDYIRGDDVYDEDTTTGSTMTGSAVCRRPGYGAVAAAMTAVVGSNIWPGLCRRKPPSLP